MPRYWLFKSEPDAYSFEHLRKDGTTMWSGVRNFQARNNMMEMQLGDLGLFYHSSIAEPAAVGICKVVATSHPDPTQFERGGELQHLLLRYTQALITQMAQTAVCNRHHTVDQQLCRWLLLSLDRLPSNELTMTQELIANMLGVRREGVTEAAGHLQSAGVIHYSRGRIVVMDRAKLEARACECYKVVRQETERLFPALNT